MTNCNFHIRAAVAHLPELRIEGVEEPAMQAIGKAKGQRLYTLRLAGSSLRTLAYREGCVIQQYLDSFKREA
jgi:hypothetical protein